MSLNPKPIKGVALRLTRNDVCDVVLAPTVPNSRMATSAFVTLTMSPDYSAGNEIEVMNADGSISVYDSPEPVLRGYGLELSVAGLPFVMLEMLAGYTALEDALGEIIGGVAPESLKIRNASSIQLEAWQRNSAAACAAGATDLFTRHLLSKTRKWRVTGDLVIEDGSVTTVLSGYAEKNPNFVPSYVGEYTPANVAIIKTKGPHAYQSTGALPANMDTVDGYVPVAA